MAAAVEFLTGGAVDVRATVAFALNNGGAHAESALDERVSIVDAIASSHARSMQHAEVRSTFESRDAYCAMDVPVVSSMSMDALKELKIGQLVRARLAVQQTFEPEMYVSQIEIHKNTPTGNEQEQLPANNCGTDTNMAYRRCRVKYTRCADDVQSANTAGSGVPVRMPTEEVVKLPQQLSAKNVDSRISAYCVPVSIVPVDVYTKDGETSNKCNNYSTGVNDCSGTDTAGTNNTTGTDIINTKIAESNIGNTNLPVWAEFRDVRHRFGVNVTLYDTGVNMEGSGDAAAADGCGVAAVTHGATNAATGGGASGNGSGVLRDWCGSGVKINDVIDVIGLVDDFTYELLEPSLDGTTGTRTAKGLPATNINKNSSNAVSVPPVSPTVQTDVGNNKNAAGADLENSFWPQLQQQATASKWMPRVDIQAVLHKVLSGVNDPVVDPIQEYINTMAAVTQQKQCDGTALVCSTTAPKVDGSTVEAHPTGGPHAGAGCTATATQGAVSSSAEDTKAIEGYSRAVQLFSKYCFGGSDIAATYFVLGLASTAMRTKMRTDDKRMLQRVTINIKLPILTKDNAASNNNNAYRSNTGATLSQIPQKILRLMDQLGSICIAIKVDRYNLEKTCYQPIWDIDTGLLTSGILPLPKGSTMVLDEVDMDAGTLNDTGCRSLIACKQLCSSPQELYCSFSEYTTVPILVEACCIVVSQGTSVLDVDRSALSVCVPSAAATAHTQVPDASEVEYVSTYLASLADRGSAGRFVPHIPDAVAEAITDNYLAVRGVMREGTCDGGATMNSERLGVLLAALTAYSYAMGKMTVTNDMWSKLKKLEEERKQMLTQQC